MSELEGPSLTHLRAIKLSVSKQINFASLSGCGNGFQHWHNVPWAHDSRSGGQLTVQQYCAFNYLKATASSFVMGNDSQSKCMGNLASTEWFTYPCLQLWVLQCPSLLHYKDLDALHCWSTHFGYKRNVWLKIKPPCLFDISLILHSFLYSFFSKMRCRYLKISPLAGVSAISRQSSRVLIDFVLPGLYTHKWYISMQL